MGVLKNIFGSATNALGSAVGGGLGNAIMGIFGGGSRARRKQLEQQQKLQDMQIKGQKEMMDYGVKHQNMMYDRQYAMNTPEAMRKLYKEAGMNPALAYTQGAVGGVSGGSTGGSVAGGQASDEASLEQVNVARQGMALQHKMMESQIELNKSVANKNNVEADDKSEDIETKRRTRELIVENLRQQGIGAQWDNALKEWDANDFSDMWKRNEVLNEEFTVRKEGNHNMQVAAAIAQAQAQTGNIIAQKLMTEEKTKLLYQEFLLELRRVKVAEELKEHDKVKTINDTIKAKAVKLAAEFTSGDHVTWKSILDAGKEALGLVATILK